MYSSIEQEVLKKITPTQTDKQHVLDAVQALITTVNQEIKKRKLPITVTLVGSIAKDTYLKTALDIDLFLLFPATTARETLEKTVREIGRKILRDTQECYAEHPYIRGLYQQYATELVPCYQIQSVLQKISAVDRTPLHTTYVQKQLRETQKPDVRLFKQFLRGIGCYGAETEIEGFSGYLCEILIIKYDSFRNLTKQAQNWTYGTKLSLTSNHIPNFSTPLIFIDPVDPKRNVASALSEKNFSLFIVACKAYQTKPRKTFFFPHSLHPWTLPQIKKALEKQPGHFIGVWFKKPDIINENLYPQLRKASRALKDICEQHDFPILGTPFFVDKKSNVIYILLHTVHKHIQKNKIHEGPPLQLKTHMQDFISKWANDPRTITKPYQKNGRIYVTIKRTYTNIEHLLNDQICHLSLGKDITLHKKSDYRLLTQCDLLRKELKLFWTAYLDNKYPWER